MKTAVIYYSKTGNTEKVARAIHEAALTFGQAELYAITDDLMEQWDRYDVLFIGAPCHGGDLALPVRAFLDSLPRALRARVAGFITHAAPVYEKADFEQALFALEGACESKDITYVASFDCQGLLEQGLHDFVRKQRNLSPEQWAGMAAAMEGHPDDDDLRRARAFCRDTLARLQG